MMNKKSIILYNNQPLKQILILFFHKQRVKVSAHIPVKHDTPEKDEVFAIVLMIGLR